MSLSPHRKEDIYSASHLSYPHPAAASLSLGRWAELPNKSLSLETIKMLVQVLQEVYARQDETCKGYWRKCRLRMRRGDRKAGRASIMQRRSDSGCGASVKLSDHSAIPSCGQGQRGPLRAAHEKAWGRSGTSPQALLSPRWEQPRSAELAPEGRKRGDRPTTLPPRSARERMSRTVWHVPPPFLGNQTPRKLLDTLLLQVRT